MIRKDHFKLSWWGLEWGWECSWLINPLLIQSSISLTHGFFLETLVHYINTIWMTLPKALPLMELIWSTIWPPDRGRGEISQQELNGEKPSAASQRRKGEGYPAWGPELAALLCALFNPPEFWTSPLWGQSTWYTSCFSKLPNVLGQVAGWRLNSAVSSPSPYSLYSGTSQHEDLLPGSPGAASEHSLVFQGGYFPLNNF